MTVSLKVRRELEPADEIDVADAQLRAVRQHMRAPALMPARQRSAAFGCDLERCAEPAVEQRELHGVLLGPYEPVARREAKLVPVRFERRLCAIGGAHAERRSEAFVVELMAIEHREHDGVLGLGGLG